MYSQLKNQNETLCHRCNLQGKPLHSSNKRHYNKLSSWNKWKEIIATPQGIGAFWSQKSCRQYCISFLQFLHKALVRQSTIIWNFTINTFLKFIGRIMEREENNAILFFSLKWHLEMYDIGVVIALPFQGNIRCTPTHCSHLQCACCKGCVLTVSWKGLRKN